MENKIEIFSERKIKKTRDKITLKKDQDNILFNKVNQRLSERLLLIKKNNFKICELGSRTGLTMKSIPKEKKVKKFFFTDISHQILVNAKEKIIYDDSIQNKAFINLNNESLPFKERFFDLVLSNLYLHWSNNFSVCLNEINRVLKPDGLFLASLFGNETLQELKYSLYKAEDKLTNTVTPRVSPFLNMQQIGSLLQTAGFNLPVIDKDTIKILYKDLTHLMYDIKSMGESNSLMERKQNFTPARIFDAAGKIYKKEFSRGNKIYATFEILYLIGWKKHKSQQKPKKPGSARKDLSEFLSKKIN